MWKARHVNNDYTIPFEAKIYQIARQDDLHWTAGRGRAGREAAGRFSLASDSVTGISALAV